MHALIHVKQASSKSNGTARKHLMLISSFSGIAYRAEAMLMQGSVAQTWVNIHEWCTSEAISISVESSTSFAIVTTSNLWRQRSLYCYSSIMPQPTHGLAVHMQTRNNKLSS